MEIMLEMCSGTSNYPWVTIWDIGMAYFGRSVARFEKNPKLHALGGGKKNNSHLFGIMAFIPGDFS